MKLNKSIYRWMLSRKTIAELKSLGIEFGGLLDDDELWPALVLPSGKTIIVMRDEEGNGVGALSD